MLTAAQVAKMLKLRVETVYRHARLGRLPAIRVGGAWRFSEDELRRWLGNGGESGARRRRARSPDPADDPILKVIGIGRDGHLSENIDQALYGGSP
jgi:excisionase family DNA binding protein